MLPPGYYAVPFLDRDGPVEIDVGTLQEPAVGRSSGESFESPAYAATSPGLTLAVEWPNIDDVRVEIVSDEGEPRLAAAIELVSPRNKDRPRAREAFAEKCADHLRRGCGVVVVDVVTTRRADLHFELLVALEIESTSDVSGQLSAMSYRSVGHERDGQLLIWPAILEIGVPLPTLPLWLGAELAVPLDLEASHSAACVDLRVKRAPEST